MEGSDTVLPFISQFWQLFPVSLGNDEGVCHTIPQGEERAQGDPLTPALFALGQHSAFVAVQESLQFSWTTLILSYSLSGRRTPIADTGRDIVACGGDATRL